MSDNKDLLIDKKIDVSEIDWNNLSVEEFHSLSNVFAERDKMLKESKKRKPRDSGKLRPLVLDDIVYMVKPTLIVKYKNMKSAKSREKLIEEIKRDSIEVEQL